MNQVHRRIILGMTTQIVELAHGENEGTFEEEWGSFEEEWGSFQEG